MEHKIGEEFNISLRVKTKAGRGGDYDCSRCAISKVCSRTYDSVSPCCNTQRKDGRYVYFEFVSVKDENEMKQQENMPEENTNNTITNDSLDLTKILKYCPAGHKFYSPIYGDVEFLMLLDSGKIRFQCYDSGVCYNLVVQSDGKLHDNGECLVFPSREQRDWGKFEAPWYNPEEQSEQKVEYWAKIERFDVSTLKPFDKVLVRDGEELKWTVGIFSHFNPSGPYQYSCAGNDYNVCIPYNKDTEHLLGTTYPAPEYYRIY